MNASPWLGWPGGVPLLFLVPLAWMLWRRLDLWRGRRGRGRIGPRAAALTVGPSRTRESFRRMGAAAGLLAIVLALLQPLVGTESPATAPAGLDVMFCLDVSRSMLAEDLSPSRLDRAREELRDLARTLAGQRVGLIAFAGQARRIVPLTHDVDALETMLAEVDPWSVEMGGTDLGAALAAGLQALGATPGRRSALVLISDGEDHPQRAAAIADECRARHIPVHCVAMGTERGAKIPLPEDGGFLTDSDGREVITRLVPADLQDIARRTEGTYCQLSRPHEPLAPLLDRALTRLLATPDPGNGPRTPASRYQWPLAVAILAWAAELLSSARVRP